MNATLKRTDEQQGSTIGLTPQGRRGWALTMPSAVKTEVVSALRGHVVASAASGKPVDEEFVLGISSRLFRFHTAYLSLEQMGYLCLFAMKFLPQENALRRHFVEQRLFPSGFEKSGLDRVSPHQA